VPSAKVWFYPTIFQKVSKQALIQIDVIEPRNNLLMKKN